jgi:uncharacterized protein (DUF1810 family)
MTTHVYICMPDPNGEFTSLKDCDKYANTINKKEKKLTILRVSKHDDRKIAIPSRLQAHIDYQNGQDRIYSITWNVAKSEISSGHKTSCWMWYIFPSFLPVRQTKQLRELALKNLEEVRAYIAVDILRNRLIEITQIAQKRLSDGISAEWLFGNDNDASKFWECITVFFLASINWKLPVPPKQDVEKLNKVCGAALRALHPHATGQDMLHTRTVNEVIKQDRTIQGLLTDYTYHQKYIKYKYKYLQYKKTLH